MEKFVARVSDDGIPYVRGSEGTRLVITSPIGGEDEVIAQRVASLLDHHNRREAFELGRSNGYSSMIGAPGETGGSHVRDRRELLEAAHAAETHAEKWDQYREHLRAVLTPPELIEAAVISANGVRNRGDEIPQMALPIPRSELLSLRLTYGVATANMEAYLAIAKQCRDQLQERYAGEHAAMHAQAEQMMRDDLEME